MDPNGLNKCPKKVSFFFSDLLGRCCFEVAACEENTSSAGTRHLRGVGSNLTWEMFETWKCPKHICFFAWIYTWIQADRIHGTGILMYICLHEWLIFYGFHVGKYASPMDPMGRIMTCWESCSMLVDSWSPGLVTGLRCGDFLAAADSLEIWDWDILPEPSRANILETHQLDAYSLAFQSEPCVYIMYRNTDVWMLEYISGFLAWLSVQRLGFWWIFCWDSHFSRKPVATQCSPPHSWLNRSDSKVRGGEWLGWHIPSLWDSCRLQTSDFRLRFFF